MSSPHVGQYGVRKPGGVGDYEHFRLVFLWPGLDFLKQILSLTGGGGGKDGPKGPDGPQGPEGPDGPQGPNGRQLGRGGEDKGGDVRGKTTHKGLL